MLVINTQILAKHSRQTKIVKQYLGQLRSGTQIQLQVQRPKITPIQREKELKKRDDEVTVKFFADNLNDFAGLGQLNLDAVVQQLT